MSDDTLLADIMRRMLDPEADGYANWGKVGDAAKATPWLTLDLSLDITNEELAAVQRATFEPVSVRPSE